MFCAKHQAFASFFALPCLTSGGFVATEGQKRGSARSYHIEEASTKMKRCGPPAGSAGIRGRGGPKSSPNTTLFEREVLAHHVARELFGAGAEGVNAIAAE